MGTDGSKPYVIDDFDCIDDVEDYESIINNLKNYEFLEKGDEKHVCNLRLPDKHMFVRTNLKDGTLEKLHSHLESTKKGLQMLVDLLDSNDYEGARTTACLLIDNDMASSVCANSARNESMISSEVSPATSSQLSKIHRRSILKMASISPTSGTKAANNNGLNVGCQKTVIPDICNYGMLQTDMDKDMPRKTSILNSGLSKLITHIQKPIDCSEDEANFQVNREKSPSQKDLNACIMPSENPKVSELKHLTPSVCLENAEQHINMFQTNAESEKLKSHPRQTVANIETSMDVISFRYNKDESKKLRRRSLTDVRFKRMNNASSKVVKRSSLIGHSRIPRKLPGVIHMRHGQSSPQKMKSVAVQKGSELDQHITPAIMSMEMFYVSAPGEELSERKVLDLKRWYCISRSAYHKSSGIVSVVSCWNFLFSTRSHGSLQPITEEIALRVLGFDSALDDIDFTHGADNITLLRWFHRINTYFRISGQCYFMYKPVGKYRTQGVTDEMALSMLKQGLRDRNTFFIYRCYNHYFCPIGYDNTLELCVDDDKKKEDTWILIGDTTRGCHSMHCVNWDQICLDLNCRSPKYFDIRQNWKGVMVQDSISNEDENFHCIMIFQKVSDIVQKLPTFVYSSTSSSTLSKGCLIYPPSSSLNESSQSQELDPLKDAIKLELRSASHTRTEEEDKDISMSHNPNLSFKRMCNKISGQYYPLSSNLYPPNENSGFEISNGEYQRQNFHQTKICIHGHQNQVWHGHQSSEIRHGQQDKDICDRFFCDENGDSDF